MIVCLSAAIVSSSAHSLFLQGIHSSCAESERRNRDFSPSKKGSKRVCIMASLMFQTAESKSFNLEIHICMDPHQIWTDLPANKKHVERIGAKGTGLSLACHKHKLILYVTFHLTYFISKWTQQGGHSKVERSGWPLSEWMTVERFRDSIVLCGKDRVHSLYSRHVEETSQTQTHFAYALQWAGDTETMGHTDGWIQTYLPQPRPALLEVLLMPDLRCPYVQ